MICCDSQYFNEFDVFFMILMKFCVFVFILFHILQMIFFDENVEGRPSAGKEVKVEPSPAHHARKEEQSETSVRSSSKSSVQAGTIACLEAGVVEEVNYYKIRKTRFLGCHQGVQAQLGDPPFSRRTVCFVLCFCWETCRSASETQLL